MTVRRYRISRLELRLARRSVEIPLAVAGFDLSKSYIRWYDFDTMTYVYEQRVDDAP